MRIGRQWFRSSAALAAALLALAPSAAASPVHLDRDCGGTGASLAAPSLPHDAAVEPSVGPCLEPLRESAARPHSHLRSSGIPHHGSRGGAGAAPAESRARAAELARGDFASTLAAAVAGRLAFPPTGPPRESSTAAR